MLATEQQVNKNGFTLIEIVVVIAVIAVLVIILIPAVQYARETSRRLSCSSNLKQIGLALNNYETAFKVYPQGSNGRLYSGQVMLLPFLDQSAIYNSINFNTVNAIIGFAPGGPNATAGNTVLSYFCCPSDPDAMRNPYTSYAWNGGMGLQREGFVGTFCSGATTNRHYVNPADITDGLSNTSAMSEWKIGSEHPPDDSTVVFRVSVQPSESYSQFVQRCQNSNRQTTQFGSWTKDLHWTLGAFGSTILNFNSPPNSLSCYYNSSIDDGNWPAGSYHNKGCNVLFHDNHVMFYGNGVAINTWKSISTKANSDNF